MQQTLKITVSLLLLTFSLALKAETLRIEGVQKAGAAPTDWSFSYTENPQQISEYASLAISAPTDKPHYVVVVNRAGELNYDFHIELQPTALAEFAIDSKNQLNGTEKKTALLVATVQSVISTFSFVYFSSGSLSAATTASILNAAMNFYFTWNPNRWGSFLNWGEKHIQTFFSKLGLTRNKKNRVVSKFAQLVTGTTGILGLTYALGGVLAWDQFLQVYTTPEFLGQTFFNGLMISFYNGVWDSVFTQWRASEHNKFKEREIRQIWRAKNLFAAFLSPMILLDIMPAKIVAFGSGVVASWALWKSEGSANFVHRGIEISKQKIKSIFNKIKSKFANTSCQRALTN